MERAEWIKLQMKYIAHKRDEAFAGDSDRENDTMILLTEICEQLWRMRTKQP
jgi:hypothetical protein